MTAASFMGYTGFTLAMPFLPLYIGQLGVADVGQVAMWTGVSLAVTPGLTALLAPAWGRLGDRFGRKIMVERSLVSFVVIMAAMAYISRLTSSHGCRLAGDGSWARAGIRSPSSPDHSSSGWARPITRKTDFLTRPDTSAVA